jgi:hypothetical protein
MDPDPYCTCGPEIIKILGKYMKMRTRKTEKIGKIGEDVTGAIELKV